MILYQVHVLSICELFRLVAIAMIKFKTGNLETSSGLGQVKTCLQAYVDSEGPDQPAHLHCLIRTLPVHLQNHWILQNVGMESKGPDDTLHICRMICICALCVCSKAFFSWCDPFGQDPLQQFEPNLAVLFFRWICCSCMGWSGPPLPTYGIRAFLPSCE